MLRWLAARGVRPLLLDWGWPGEIERQFSLTDYVAGRMERAMAAAAQAVAAASGAGRLLHGWHLGRGGGSAPAGSYRRAGAAGRALGFSCA